MGSVFVMSLNAAENLLWLSYPMLRGDVRDAPVGFPQQLRRFFHTVLLHIGSHGHAVYRLKVVFRAAVLIRYSLASSSIV